MGAIQNALMLYLCAPHRTTLARSLSHSLVVQFIMHVFVFLSLSYVFFRVFFLCGCVGCADAERKGIIAGICRTFLPNTEKNPALITVNNSNRYNSICTVLSFVWLWMCECGRVFLWISLKSILQPERLTGCLTDSFWRCVSSLCDTYSTTAGKFIQCKACRYHLMSVYVAA